MIQGPGRMGRAPARVPAERRLGEHALDAASGAHDHLIDFNDDMTTVSNSTSQTTVYSKVIRPLDLRPGRGLRHTLIASLENDSGAARTLRIYNELAPPVGVNEVLIDYTTGSLPANLAWRQVVVETMLLCSDDAYTSLYSVTTVTVGLPGSSAGIAGGVGVSELVRFISSAFNQDVAASLTFTIKATLSAASSSLRFLPHAAIFERL